MVTSNHAICYLNNADSAKVDPSFKGGAHAMGAEVTITDTPGYLPLVPANGLSDVLKDHLVRRHLGADQIQEGQHSFPTGTSES